MTEAFIAQHGARLEDDLGSALPHSALLTTKLGTVPFVRPSATAKTWPGASFANTTPAALSVRHDAQTKRDTRRAAIHTMAG